jgi:Mg-chelatase subunit ChlD
MKSALTQRLLVLAGAGLSAAFAATCAAGSSSMATTASAGTGGSGGMLFTSTSTGTTATGTTATSSASGGTAGGDAGPDPDAACALITEQATSAPVNLYIALDKSSSMAGNKWTSAKAGLGVFVNDPNSAGIQVALNFFPLDNNPTCDQFAYKPAKVAFGPLPQNAMPVTAAMAAEQPDGFLTPMYPALGGAILGAKEQSDNNPGQIAAVLLVTDGQPDGPAMMCGGVNPDDPQAIADLAAAGVQNGVKTFVIGLPGVNQAIANQIAKSGGTDAAILVGGLDVQTEFQKALAKVRGEALPCEYELPAMVEGGQVDPGNVNILLTPAGQPTAILPQDNACKDKGWKYDDPQKPTKIIFCSASCQDLKIDFGAKVQILLGCKTEVAK